MSKLNPLIKTPAQYFDFVATARSQQNQTC